MYTGVPTASPAAVMLLSVSVLASPKSSTLTWPCAVTKRLPGFDVAVDERLSEHAQDHGPLAESPEGHLCGPRPRPILHQGVERLAA